MVAYEDSGILPYPTIRHSKCELLPECVVEVVLDIGPRSEHLEAKISRIQP